MTNPLDIIRERENAQRLESERRVETEHQVVIEQFYEYFTDVPTQIEEREFRDCTIRQWENEDYATFEFKYYDSDGSSRGLDLYLFFNSNNDMLAIFKPDEARFTHALSGGTILDEDTLPTFIKGSSSNDKAIEEAIVLMAHLKERAKLDDAEPWRKTRINNSLNNSDEIRLKASLHDERQVRMGEVPK